MSRLAEEIRIWYTPVISAYLLWSFTKGYIENHKDGSAPSGLLHFIALGILSSPSLKATISNHREDLQAYVRGFEDKKNIDLLLSIQDKALKQRENTLKAIDIAITKGMLAWDIETGAIHVCNIHPRVKGVKPISAAIQKDAKCAEILGKWFSKHDVKTIAAYLKVIL